MNQLFIIIISITYGLLFGLLFNLIKEKYLLQIMLFLSFTLLYIYIIYLINFGIINIFMKLCLIFGFIMSNLLKKCKIKIFNKN